MVGSRIVLDSDSPFVTCIWKKLGIGLGVSVMDKVDIPDVMVVMCGVMDSDSPLFVEGLLGSSM